MLNAKRNSSIDLLRIICCVFVIGIHVTVDYSLTVNKGMDSFIQMQSLLMNNIVRVGLPVFFVISGYFLLNNKINNIFLWYKKRIIQLIIPFLIYSSIHFFFINENFNSFHVIKFLSSLVMSQTSISVHFWFVYSMLGIYILTPAINKLLENITGKSTYIAIIAILALNSYHIYGKYIPIIDVIKNVIPLQAISTWFSYFILGGLIKRVEPLKYTSWILFICFIISGTAIYTTANYKVNLSPYDMGTSMMMYSVSLLLFFRELIKIKSERIISVIAFTEKRTYAIYLIHFCVLILFNRYTGIPFITNLLIPKIIFVTLCVFMISFIISCIVDKLIVDRLIKLT